MIQFFSSFGWRARGLRKRRAWLEGCVQERGQQIEDISVVFMLDEELLEMNRRHLNHDEYTDIITFDMRERIPADALKGELYISVDRVKENARLNGHGMDEELDRVMVHGLLHMLGFKDKTAGERAAMRAEEDRCLEGRVRG
ncbi:MAG: rRNA maturation RNase YbeY [Bacteroidia bacterium]